MTTAEVENPFAGQGAVLLDIGGDVGALVVTTPAEMVGVEVESLSVAIRSRAVQKQREMAEAMRLSRA